MTDALQWRALAIGRLANEEFDVLVIGGGITGAAIARDAQLRGLTTALIERDDFASGTSSRSSRLIHGGVRYLEHGHIHLVFESCRERRTLLRVAPHLVRPLAFTWPVYRGARISRAKLGLGLTLYDALALFRNIARHERLNRDDVLRGEPALNAAGLLGGARYYDASTDDARLTLANVIGAREAGATVVNHATVTGLLTEGGRARGASVVDACDGRQIAVRARVVVNATGPWSDSVASFEERSGGSSIIHSKGVHIAVPASRVRNHGAVTVLHPDDGRVMFTLPAGHQTIIGTTETTWNGPPGDVRAEPQDVTYLLAAVNAYFPRAQLGERDVISAWAGVRPLAAYVAGGNRGNPGSASREHAITRGSTGMWSVTGGKLTTYRAVAEEVVDVATRELRARVASCRTETAPLPGAEAAASPEPVAPDGLRERLKNLYGNRWPEVWSLAVREPEWAAPVVPGLPHLGVEYAYGVLSEMAVTLGDTLLRRTHAGFECADHALGAAPAVCRLVAPLLGWDSRRQTRELERLAVEARALFG